TTGGGAVAGAFFTEDRRMGQYYLVVNLDKKEYIHPHQCGDGLKLMEFGASSCGTMTALAVLLADGNGRGGGDLHSRRPVVGSWAGDRVVLAGDYGDDCKFTGDAVTNLYGLAIDGFRDVSREALRAMADDAVLARVMRCKTTWHGGGTRSVYEYAVGGADPAADG